ncbi:MAG: TonB-dependent receptor [Bacteroidaceae bacterium]|nr:TonB-dependent receptor [Bacteroidaceae bacterium]
MITSLLATALLSCAMADTTVVMDAVTVAGHSHHDAQMKSSLASVQVGRNYMQEHFSGSLMQTLEALPGVKAMSIGSGQSKPIIRGLGFNRVVVCENGIKHEGQQWGDDHGLEVDQFAIDRAEVVKGPASLAHGSDAIGGVLDLYANYLPTERLEGAVQLFGRSNNGQVGLSAKVGGRTGRFFYRANVTLTDYADYSVPTDSIQYYSYYIRLHKQRLRNTAGRERDGSLMLGYLGRRFHTDLRISDSYSKSGFFADAHGLEVRLSDIDYDRSRRDIDLPHQWVNHLKVQSHSTWFGPKWNLEANLAYQRNLRQEHSEPVSHGYMPMPGGTLEREFRKDTYTGQLALRYTPATHHTLRVGLTTEHQRNRRDGWGFILPDFETTGLGLYAIERYEVNERLVLNAGVRYDHQRTHIRSYSDWFKIPTTAAGDSVYKERSANCVRHFNSFTWSAGLNYSLGQWVLKMNVGKSFRTPIPKELGADGVNYHIFRYERGNADLDPEESYQLDCGVFWENDRWNVELNPFVNYFPNYIYLNPTAQYVEGLQLYEYTQARVLRWGMEAQLAWRITPHWEAEAQGEYLYARQQSGQKKGYSLPFSTPWSTTVGLRYLYDWKGKGYVGLNAHIVGRQDEIVPPEKPTDGHWTLNFSAGKDFHLGQSKLLKVTLLAQNLLNRRYYDHTSYYRLIDVPEPGINVSGMVAVEF